MSYIMAAKLANYFHIAKGFEKNKTKRSKKVV